MFGKSKSNWLVIGIAAVLATGIPAAQKTTPANRPPDKLALAEDEVKQLLLLMDTDSNGKISRKEFMDFMAAEFDRLDKNKNGELDPKELAQSRLRVSQFSHAGK